MREKLNNLRYRLFGRIGRILILIILLSIVALTAIAGFAAQQSVRQRSIQSFDRDRKTSDQHFTQSMQHYGDVLYQSRSFIRSSQKVSQDEWKEYFKNQDVFGRYKGISSIYFVEPVTNANKASFIDRMRKEPDFGGAAYNINPAGSRDIYGMPTLYISSNNVSSSVNFDVFSSADRRAVYETSLKNDVPTASQPLTFATGAKGFFVTLPVRNNADKLLGYVGISFRSEQLFKTLYDQDMPKELDIRISETGDGGAPIELYESENWQKNTEAKLTSSDTFEIAGRTWLMQYKADANYDADANGRYLPWAIVMAGSLLVIILAIAITLLIKSGEQSS